MGRDLPLPHSPLSPRPALPASSPPAPTPTPLPRNTTTSSGMRALYPETDLSFLRTAIRQSRVCVCQPLSLVCAHTHTHSPLLICLLLAEQSTVPAPSPRSNLLPAWRTGGEPGSSPSAPHSSSGL